MAIAGLLAAEDDGLMQHAYRCGTRQLTLTLHRAAPGRFAATLEGRERAVDAALLDGSTLRLSVDGIGHTVYVARNGDTYHVAVDGEVYVLAPVAGPSEDDHAPVLAAPQLVAPMPGKVLQVLARVGQTVAAGDGLLILEAMKMEHRIAAEAAATVRAIHVTENQMVDAGAVLVELEYV